MACRLIGDKPLPESMMTFFLLIRHIGTNLSEILIGVQLFSLTNMQLKVSEKYRLFRSGTNVLNNYYIIRPYRIFYKAQELVYCCMIYFSWFVGVTAEPLYNTAIFHIITQQFSSLKQSYFLHCNTVILFNILKRHYLDRQSWRNLYLTLSSSR